MFIQRFSGHLLLLLVHYAITYSNTVTLPFYLSTNRAKCTILVGAFNGQHFKYAVLDCLEL